MTYRIGELKFSDINKFRKQGYYILVHKCPLANRCSWANSRNGRDRCPGSLVEFDSKYQTYKWPDNCGWKTIGHPTKTRTNSIEIKPDVYPQYKPPEDLFLPL